MSNTVFELKKNSLNTNFNRYSEKIFAVALIIPAFIMLCITIITPLVQVVTMSFQKCSMLSLKTSSWNYFKNYIALFSNSDFAMAFLRTLYYVAMTTGSQLIVGLSLALLLNKIKFGKRFFRSLLFLPWTIPTIVVAVVWMWIYQPQYGVLNYILTSLHILKTNANWLSDVNSAMPALSLAAMWRQMPLMMIMLFAALQTVPSELEEAASIDGANGFVKFMNVTLPCIMSVIKTVVLTSIITNFQMFGLFYTMTGGGPINATTTLTIYTYKTAFMSYDLGKGSAIGVVWLIFLFVFATVYNSILSKKEIYA
jgi:multiple sugar transport system permease protein